nr:MAG TPA: hypothetical protein [Caudoviricetes sp.]
MFFHAASPVKAATKILSLVSMKRVRSSLTFAHDHVVE